MLLVPDPPTPACQPLSGTDGAGEVEDCSTPSLVVGGVDFRIWALNWSPCSLSLTHQPLPVNHSPALMEGTEPRTVTWSRCPRILTRRTANPLSSLKKVTRSTRPAISSILVSSPGEVAPILIEVYRPAVRLRGLIVGFEHRPVVPIVARRNHGPARFSAGRIGAES